MPISPTTLPTWIVRAFLLVATSGPLSHYCLWVRFIVDDYVEKIFTIFLLSQPVLILLLSKLGNTSIIQAYVLSCFLQATYLITLALSISIYRLFLHPTKAFPGPFWARLSAWWKVKAFAESGTRGYLVFNEVHKQYGDVVRVGPRQISINHVDALSSVNGRNSKCSRASNSDLMRDGNIMCLKSKAEHAKRRVAWDQALGSRACNDYLPRITQVADAWIREVRKKEGRPISITNWVQIFAFDVSGDSGWGRSYGQIESGQKHTAIDILHKDIEAAIYGIQLAWLINMLYLVPGFPDPSKPLKDHCARMLKERKKHPEKETIDVLSFLEQGTSGRDEKTLISDLRLLTLAASDTSYSAMVFCLYYLTRFPELQAQLREEVIPAFDGDGQPNWPKLQGLPLLDSIIQETLRMNPPVPQGLLRELPANEDAMIGPYHVPGGTQLSCPTWTLHHDARYWERPNEWIHERWTTRPELIKDRRAFVAFGLGPMMCAGKYFAMQEMKVFIGKVVMAFDLKLEKGDDGSKLLRSKDCFTMSLPEQMMILEPRKT